MLKITQIKSNIGIKPKHKLILICLGLRKIGDFKIKKENKSIIGMINKIKYMLKIEYV